MGFFVRWLDCFCWTSWFFSLLSGSKLDAWNVPPTPLRNSSLWFTNDVVTVKHGDTWLRWSSMRQPFGCSEIFAPVLQILIY